MNIFPPKREEIQIPDWLKSRDDYVKEDWKAFRDTRSNGHKDAVS